MLKEFVDMNHYKFAVEAKDWEDAIRMSCEMLELDGTVEENYKEDIIAGVKKYGPYIVITPNVAMPHSQECAKGVNKTAISFMRLEKPVSFEPGNKDMDAQLFFTLASCNPEQHLSNMTKLVEVLMNDELLKKLIEVTTVEELLFLQKEYLS